MDKSIARPEYPRPQFFRDKWLNLNGVWTFEFDFGDSGMQEGRQLFNSTGFGQDIVVPFCPESELSGVGYKDFINAMWYHRKVTIPQEWDGNKIFLHFGGVDYESEIFVDGKSAGLHFGGNSSFSVDITAFVNAGQEHDLVVHVRDILRPAGTQAAGKQSTNYKSAGCHYTRTTGIWQTVWMEAVCAGGLKDVAVVPDLDNKRFICTPAFYSDIPESMTLTVCAFEEGKEVAKAAAVAANGSALILQIDNPRTWCPDSPFLYDLKFVLADCNGEVLDTVMSYAGMRKVHVKGSQFYLNNKPFYQRLVLDQGFYPDGIWTAPSDEALRRDIELSMKAGFNGARLHQKVFEERFHYWADKLGYVTWGEYSSWGCDPFNPAAAGKMLAEWREIVARDRNHPSIIVWTPWNETRYNRFEGSLLNDREHRRSHHEAYNICKTLDPTRPVNDTSGYVHRMTDLWTVHNYEQDTQKLRDALAMREDGGVFRNFPDLEYEYSGQPYLLAEFGGIKWIPEEERPFADNSWGYGDSPQTLQELYLRLEGQIDSVLSLKHICGYCYTQLTDVEQEQNGIYKYDRTEKFDMERVHHIFAKKP